MTLPADMLNQVFTWYPQSGSKDFYNDHTYNAPQTVRGRLELKKERIEDQDGRVVISQGRWFVQPEVTAKENDRVVYTDNNGDEREFVLLSLEEQYDRVKLHHRMYYMKFQTPNA